MKNIPILLLSTNILSVTPFCTLLEESVVRIANSWNNPCIKTIRNYFNPLCTVCQLEPNAQYSKTRISKVDRYYLKVKHQITAIILSRIEKNPDLNRIHQRIRICTNSLHILPLKSQIETTKRFSGKKTWAFLSCIIWNFYFSWCKGYSFWDRLRSFFNLTSESKKRRQIAVVYPYCNLSVFLTRTLLSKVK